VRQEDAECDRRIIADACSGVESSLFEFPVSRRDGSEVLGLHNTATSGEIFGMVGMGQDMTTLRRALTGMSNVADELRHIIEHTNTPILGINMDSQYSKDRSVIIDKPLIDTSSVLSTKRRWAESCAWPSTASTLTAMSSRTLPR